MRKILSICKVLALLPLLGSIVGCTPKSEATASIFQLEGVEPAVYYTAPTPLADGFDGELAIIMLQGWHGGVQVLPEYLALQAAISEAYVISPMYPRTEMTEQFGIEPDGRAIWNESWNPQDLSKPGTPDDDWRGGGDANGTELSSFDIIDLLFAKLSDKDKFPNLKRIALVGFSAGGQFVGRYVAVGKGEVREGIELVYAAMAPSTFLTLNEEDTWHYGLNNRPRYSRDLTTEQILNNLRTRRCLHGCGVLDTLSGSLDQTPCAMKQGENRYIRFQNFQNTVNADPEWSKSVVFYTFENIGHEASKAYADPFFADFVRGK